MSASSQAFSGSVAEPPIDAARLLEALFASVVLFVASGALFPLLRNPLGERGVTSATAGPESVVFALALPLTLILLIPLRRDLLVTMRGDWLLWALPILALTSALWSTDRSLTLHSCASLIFATLFGAYLALRFGAHGQLQILCMTLGFALLLSVVFVFFAPEYGLDATHSGAWRGIFDHKNGFGRVDALAFSLCAVAALRVRCRGLALLLAASSVSLILLSHSRTSLAVAAVVAIMVAASPLTRRVRIRAGLVAAVLLAVFGALALLSWQQRSTMLQPGIDAGETFSGRTVLWLVVVEKIGERPLIGHGYAAFWRGHAGQAVDVWRIVGWHPPHSHNAFLDVALDLGLVGAALFFFVWVRTLTRAFRLQGNERLSTLERMLPSAIATFTLVAFLTEGNLVGNGIWWMLFTAASVIATKHSLSDPEPAP